MRIRTPIDLGALIRERRKALRLDQKTLAEKVGVSRQWIVDVEQGKPRLEIGLVLRTADALGIVLTVDQPTPNHRFVLDDRRRLPKPDTEMKIVD